MLAAVGLLVAIGGAGGIVWSLLRLPGGTLSALDAAASVTGLLVAVLGLWLAVAAGRPGDSSLDDAQRGFAAAVRAQWNQEIGTRRLRLPRPIRLSWAPTRRADIGASAELVGAPAPAGRLGPLGDNPAVELVTAFRALPGRQLVVLGRPGAGKSVLAMFLAVGLVDGRADDDPVPVLVSVAGWNPKVPLRRWLARRVHEEYPEVVTARQAAALVDQNRVVAILDGLDEMPRSLGVAALAAIDEIAGDGFSVVVTSRAKHYAALVAAVGRPLARAAVIEVKRVSPEDASTYLGDGDAGTGDRWTPVVDGVRSDPTGPLAAALSTPLMLYLARTVYRAARSRPEQLVQCAANGGTDAVEAHLLRRFVPTAYAAEDTTYAEPRDTGRRAYPADRVARWLTTLAGPLAAASPGGQRLDWRRFDRAAPRLMVVTLLTLVCGVVGGPLGWVFALTFDHAPGRATAFGVVTGLAAGVIGGLGTTRRDAADGGQVTATAFAMTSLRDGLAGSVVATTGITLLASGATGWFHVANLARVVFTTLFAGVLLAGLGNALVVVRSAVPNSRRLRARDDGVAERVMPVALIGGAVAATGTGWMGGSVSGAAVGGLLGTLILTGMLSLFVTLAKATAFAPKRRTTRSAVRGDCTALAAACLVCGLAAAVLVGLPVLILASIRYFSEWDALLAAVLAGTAMAVFVAVGSGAAWTRYRAAIVILAVTGRLPWRLVRFLEDAHRRGVLRQLGTTYLFRHQRVQAYLRATDDTAPVPSLVSLPPRLRTVIALVSAVVLFGAQTTIIVADRVALARAESRKRATNLLDEEALRIHRTDPVAALRMWLAAKALSPTAEDEELFRLVALKQASGAATAWVFPDTCWCLTAHDGADVVAASRDAARVLRVDGSSGSISTVSLPEPFHNVGFTESAHHVITVREGARNDLVALWDVRGVEPVRIAELPDSGGMWFSLSEAGEWVLVDDGDKVAAVDLRPARPIRHDLGRARSARFLGGDRYLVLMPSDVEAVVYDLAGPAPAVVDVVATAKPVGRPQGQGALFMAGHGGAMTAVVEVAGTLQVRDLGHVLWAGISDDGRWAYRDTPGGAIELVDVVTGATRTVGERPKNAYDMLYFTEDSRYLVISEHQEPIELVPVVGTPGRVALPFGEGTVLAVSSDGRSAVQSTSFDEVVVWSLDPRPRVAAVIPGALQVTYDQSGRSLTTVTKSVVATWDVATLAALADTDVTRLACRAAGRGLTEQEWETLIPDVEYQRTC
ncbi:hypothetical protein GCM10010483_64290 [Actinokineospora diospyrosa]